MKKLATKLTPAIKEWIKEEFKTDWYKDGSEFTLFHFPNYKNYKGFLKGSHSFLYLENKYTKVSEKEFLSEFSTKTTPIIQFLYNGNWIDCNKESYRIKPSPDYSEEIEALQNKAKEN